MPMTERQKQTFQELMTKVARQFGYADGAFGDFDFGTAVGDPPDATGTNIEEASATAGLMSGDDKDKLDTLRFRQRKYSGEDGDLAKGRPRDQFLLWATRSFRMNATTTRSRSCTAPTGRGRVSASSPS